MSRIALALPLDLEEALASEIVHHGHDVVARCDAAAELGALIGPRAVDCAIVAATTRHLSEQLLTECDAAGVRLIALAGTEAERRHAAALGLFDVVAPDAGWPQIERQLTGDPHDPPAPPSSSGARRAQVIGVWGPAGAPGRTSVAIALAAELAAAGHSVALGDVDTYSGAIAPTLGLLDEAPGFAAACRLAGANGLTVAELERVAQLYRSPRGDFWVLTGIGRPRRWPELSAERVMTTIERMRDWVDFVVLDTGFSLENDEEISSDLFAPRRNAATVAALRAADRVIAVGSADPVGLARFLRAHVDLVETVATDDITVVMTRVRASAIGLNPAGQLSANLARFGGILDPVLVPHDPAGHDAALLAGRTLADVAPSSPARQAIRRLVETRIAPPEPAPRGARLWRWRRPIGRAGEAGLRA